MATKIKHNEDTLNVKYNGLKELEKGRPNKYVANQFSIPCSTLATRKKNEKKIFNLELNPLLLKLTKSIKED